MAEEIPSLADSFSGQTSPACYRESARTACKYDHRGRLIKEEHTESFSGQTPYKLWYEYDRVGNRTVRRNFSNGIRDEYVYDYSDSGHSGAERTTA